jgi:centractin
MKSDMDLRRSLFSQVVLAGGSTLLPGFGERLLSEVKQHHLAPKNTKIRITAPADRHYSAFVGGSILASLSTFKSMWISRADYLEQGARIVHGSAT